MVRIGRSQARAIAASTLIAMGLLGLSACDDPRSSSELLEPWTTEVIPLTPQGPRASDHALVFTTNLEFVVVKKLETPQKICRPIAGDADTATVHTTVPDENCVAGPDGRGRCTAEENPRRLEIESEVSVPGESRMLCEERTTIDAPRASRVLAIVRPKRAGVTLDTDSVQELSLGLHPNELLRQALPEGELRAPLNRLKLEDETLVAIKANGLRLASVNVELGKNFEPGDDIIIDAVVEGYLGSGISVMGSPVATPAFRQ